MSFGKAFTVGVCVGWFSSVVFADFEVEVISSESSGSIPAISDLSDLLAFFYDVSCFYAIAMHMGVYCVERFSFVSKSDFYYVSVGGVVFSCVDLSVGDGVDGGSF